MLLQGAEAWNAWRAQGIDEVRDPPDDDTGVEDRVLDLSGADLRGLDLTGALLAGVSLQAADLTDADLRNCDLSGADLVLCDLSGANLGGARLAGADFSGARLDGAWLQYADLSEVLGLTSAQVSLALYNDNTILPPYLDALPENDGTAYFTFEAEEDFSSLAATDIYDLLGISPEASISEIRTAFRNLAKKYHPDVNPDDPNAVRRFAQVTEAYRFAIAAAKARGQLERRRGGFGWVQSASLVLLALALPALALYWLHSRSTANAPLEKADLVVHAIEQRVTLGADPPALPQFNAEQSALPAANTESGAEPESEATAQPVPEHNAVQDLPDMQPAAAPLPQQEPEAPAAFSRPWQEEWQSLRSSTDLRALQNYIQRYPDRNEAQQAREKFRSELGATEDADALRRVVRDLPGDAPEAVMVNQKLAALGEKQGLEDEERAWRTASEAGTVAAYRAYLRRFASGRYADAANKRLDALQAELQQRSKADDLAWAQARRENTVDALEEYLQAFPDGNHADAADRELFERSKTRVARKKEDQAWLGAKQANTRDAFRSYLKAYPKGRYASLAKQKLGQPGSDAASPVPSANATLRSRTARPPRSPKPSEPVIEGFPGQ
jgi:hypothetical protein